MQSYSRTYQLRLHKWHEDEDHDQTDPQLPHFLKLNMTLLIKRFIL